MGFIEWTPNLDLGIATIDAQHRVLVERINALARAGEDGLGREATGEILEGLVAYVAEHFALEEELFERFSYPAKEAHVEEHRAFSAKVLAWKEAFGAGKAELGAEMLGFLRSWLTRHIGFTDRKYRSFFSGKYLG